jgi:hypothetical protein
MWLLSISTETEQSAQPAKGVHDITFSFDKTHKTNSRQLGLWSADTSVRYQNA